MSGITDAERRAAASLLRQFGENGAWREFESYVLAAGPFRLADLVEPAPERTCRDASRTYGRFECSACGCSVDEAAVDNGGLHYCPDCGKAVERW